MSGTGRTYNTATDSIRCVFEDVMKVMEDGHLYNKRAFLEQFLNGILILKHSTAILPPLPKSATMDFQHPKHLEAYGFQREETVKRSRWARQSCPILAILVISISFLVLGPVLWLQTASCPSYFSGLATGGEHGATIHQEFPTARNDSLVTTGTELLEPLKTQTLGMMPCHKLGEMRRLKT